MSRSHKVEEDRWTVVSTGQPRIAHYCSSCKQSTAYQSSNKIRLNSQGKKLDAWLIYRCVECEHVWNRPILERVARKRLSNQEIKELEQNHPDLIKKFVQDPGRFPIWTESETVFEIHMGREVSALCLPTKVQVQLIGLNKVRLDRLLAQGFKTSRSRVQRAIREHAILTQSKYMKDGNSFLIRKAFWMDEVEKKVGSMEEQCDSILNIVSD